MKAFMPFTHCYRAAPRLTAVIAVTCFTGAVCVSAQAAEVSVAVAANFTGPVQAIAPLFERDTGHKVHATFGATGKFYAQITNGAPFEVLLAADDETPARLVKEGYGVSSTTYRPYTYAIGKLVLWSSNPKGVDPNGEILKKGGFEHLALANPKTAPYGAAAIEVLTQMGVLDTLRPLFVQGENIAQTHQFIKTGNAELGFVAYSQVIKNGAISEGSGWIVPAALYAPIRQDAVLLAKGKDNTAARAWLDYIQSAKAQEIIRSFGYDLP